MLLFSISTFHPSTFREEPKKRAAEAFSAALIMLLAVSSFVESLADRLCQLIRTAGVLHAAERSFELLCYLAGIHALAQLSDALEVAVAST